MQQGKPILSPQAWDVPHCLGPGDKGSERAARMELPQFGYAHLLPPTFAPQCQLWPPGPQGTQPLLGWWIQILVQFRPYQDQELSYTPPKAGLSLLPGSTLEHWMRNCWYSPGAPSWLLVLRGLHRSLLLLGWKESRWVRLVRGWRVGDCPCTLGATEHPRHRQEEVSQHLSSLQRGAAHPLSFPGSSSPHSPPWGPTDALTDQGDRDKGRDTPSTRHPDRVTPAPFSTTGGTCKAGRPAWHGRSPTGMDAESAPSDFSNCSSRLDRSVASIPGPGREHCKSGQPKLPGTTGRHPSPILPLHQPP